jgi:hypothetical protein
MDLHGQIMNLPARLPSDCAKMATSTAYKAGHRDARHAAAELALTTDATMEEAAKIIEELCMRYSHPAPLAALARLRFGAA